MEEPHWRSTVVAATVSGQPATSTATRPTLSACSPICVTQPICTSSTCAGASPTLPISPLRTSAARSSARTVASVPLRRPMAERTASTISASVTPGPYPTGRERSRACGRRDRSARQGRAGSRRRPGSRSSARSSATRVSSRARCMPRQTCGPWANATWRLRFARLGSKRSGSGKTAGSRFAPASESVTRSPFAIAAPPSSVPSVA